MSLGRPTAAEGHAALVPTAVTGEGGVAGATAAEAAVVDALEPEDPGGIFADHLWNSFFFTCHNTFNSHGMRIPLPSSLGQLERHIGR